MVIEANRRHHLYEQARASWDAQAADTLMDMLPPDPDALATKQGVALLGADLRAEMAELRTEMAELRTELRTEMAELRTELRTELHDAIARQTTTLCLGAVGAILTSTGLALATAHLA